MAASAALFWSFPQGDAAAFPSAAILMIKALWAVAISRKTSSGFSPQAPRSSGDTLPNSVAGAGVRASAVWDFLRVVAWVRAFAV